MIFGILVELSYNPSRSVGDSEIQDFPGDNKVVKRMCQFLNGSGVIPMVQKEKGLGEYHQWTYNKSM